MNTNLKPCYLCGAVPLSLLLNKLQLLSLTQRRFILIRIVAFTRVLRVSTFVRFLYWHAWGWGRDSSVGTATRYGLDGPGIESRWGTRFSAPVQIDTGAHPASYRMGTGPFLRVERPGRGVDHPPQSCAEVEGRVELYVYSPSGPSWPVIGWPLPLLYTVRRQLLWSALHVYMQLPCTRIKSAALCADSPGTFVLQFRLAFPWRHC